MQKRFTLHVVEKLLTLNVYTPRNFSISSGTDNDRLKENYCFPRERNHNSSVNKCTFTKVYRKKSSQGTIHTYLGKGNMSLEFSVRHQIYTLASPAVARDRCCYHTNFIAVPPSVKAIAQVDRVVTTQSQLLQPLSGLCVQRFLLLKWSICIILCFSTLSLGDGGLKGIYRAMYFCQSVKTKKKRRIGK